MATGMIGWIEDHPDIALAGGVVGVLLIAGSMFKAKTPAGVPAAQDLSGLKNGIVYVPTQTSFTTNNRTQSGVFASNDPLLTGVTTGPVNSPTTTTTRTTTGGTTTTNPPPRPATCRSGYHFQSATLGAPIPAGSYPITGGYCIPDTPPVRVPPPPGPNPPPTTKKLIWDASYTVIGGDSLSAIAAKLTPKLRAQGMPGSMSITWTDLWQHNEGVVTKYANMYGHYTNVQDWIFPGETLTVPRWA